MLGLGVSALDDDDDDDNGGDGGDDDDDSTWISPLGGVCHCCYYFV